MNYIAPVISNISNGYIHLYWTGHPILPQAVNVRVDAPLSQKMIEEYHLKFAYCLGDIRFKPFNVINIQLAGAYISEEMTDIH